MDAKGGKDMFEMVPRKKPGIRKVSQFRDELDNLFSRFIDLDFPTYREWLSNAPWNPAVDVAEGTKEIIVKAELPGIDAKDIDVSLDGRQLTIKGEKKQESEKAEDNYHRMERSYGFFSRSLELPAEVDQDKVEASYKKGVLKIVLKKIKPSEAKKIEIKTS
jgi:HSP20 family protein